MLPLLSSIAAYIGLNRMPLSGGDPTLGPIYVASLLPMPMLLVIGGLPRLLNPNAGRGLALMWLGDVAVRTRSLTDGVMVQGSVGSSF